MTFNGYSSTNRPDSFKHNYPFSLTSFTVYGPIGLSSSQRTAAIEVAPDNSKYSPTMIFLPRKCFTVVSCIFINLFNMVYISCIYNVSVYTINIFLHCNIALILMYQFLLCSTFIFMLCDRCIIIKKIYLICTYINYL